MSKKYKFTGEEKTIRVGKENREITVKRIIALTDFFDVAAGDLGGWIQFKSNLSQKGNCWVYDDSCVCEGARVFDDSIIDYGAVVCGKAKISETAKVSGVKIGGNSVLNGVSKIQGEE
ncbi:hypothetical protein MVQ25_07795 [Fusobacterium necrophorum]|uniref:hypothetical protein n=1 Tax=Fusobacterium necrophorum TaxID=859 RepID=UPI00254C5704|nr:hypothetical protein [Fusobacterium necrophorum]MDK4497888.1 hypothetical protein [Fusobacterium necrophorum]